MQQLSYPGELLLSLTRTGTNLQSEPSRCKRWVWPTTTSNEYSLGSPVLLTKILVQQLTIPLQPSTCLQANPMELQVNVTCQVGVARPTSSHEEFTQTPESKSYRLLRTEHRPRGEGLVKWPPTQEGLHPRLASTSKPVNMPVQMTASRAVGRQPGHMNRSRQDDVGMRPLSCRRQVPIGP